MAVTAPTELIINRDLAHYPSWPWLRPSQAAPILGVRKELIQQSCKNGFFRLGYHYRLGNGRDATIPRYQIHVGRCAERMATPLTER